MYTSVTEDRPGKRFKPDCEKGLKTGMRYLIASVIIEAAAAVYGLFSHGVYSYFMTYAFMIPLLLGAMPNLTAAMKNATGKTGDDMQFALIATLTIGSLLKGALDIYGTTSRLLIVYPVISILIIAAALMLTLFRPGCRQRSR